jgi:hypothetical protein
MKRISCRNEKQHKDKKNRLGVILLVIGLVLLGRNLHIVPNHLSPLIFSLPMLLLVIGIGKVILNNGKAWGLVFIATGGLLLWNKIIPLSHSQWLIAWPGIFIVVGLVLILSYLIKPSKHEVAPKQKKKSKYDDVEFDIDKIEPIES